MVMAADTMQPDRAVLIALKSQGRYACRWRLCDRSGIAGPKLFPQGFACRRILGRLSLPVNVTARIGRFVENMIRRLNEMRFLEFPQKIAGTNQTDTGIDESATLDYVGVLEQEQGLGIRVPAEEILQHFD